MLTLLRLVAIPAFTAYAWHSFARGQLAGQVDEERALRAALMQACMQARMCMRGYTRDQTKVVP